MKSFVILLLSFGVVGSDRGTHPSLTVRFISDYITQRFGPGVGEVTKYSPYPPQIWIIIVGLHLYRLLRSSDPVFIIFVILPGCHQTMVITQAGFLSRVAAKIKK